MDTRNAAGLTSHKVATFETKLANVFSHVIHLDSPEAVRSSGATIDTGAPRSSRSELHERGSVSRSAYRVRVARRYRRRLQLWPSDFIAKVAYLPGGGGKLSSSSLFIQPGFATSNDQCKGDGGESMTRWRS
jgi:hypothetical protein